MRINIGAGHVRLDGFTRVDIDKTTDPDICCRAEDLNQHVDNNTADEIRASHILEHIPPGRDCFHALRAWWKVLKPGGLITVIVPDADFARKYADWTTFEKVILGGDPGATEYMIHKNVFSEAKLMRYLTLTGYTGIENHTKPGKYEITIRAYKPVKEIDKNE